MRVLVSLSIVIALQASATANDLTIREPLASIFDEVEIEIVPAGLTERLVRWQRAVRDFVYHAAEGLALIAEHNGTRIPDVSVLTTEPVENTESSGFGWRDDPIRHRAKFHTGADFRGKHGTPVLAAGSGVVVFAGHRGGYGNLIEIDHGGGVITRYAHLRRIHVRSGAKEETVVLGGQKIGEIGSTGRTTGPHLHFEVRLGDSPVDPVQALTVAQLTRESPEMGRIAAFALAPEVQAEVASTQDPPKQKPSKRASRPERRGHVKRIKPVS